MKLTVIGATGPTGRLVVDQALSAGHDLTVIARRPDAVSSHPRLRVIAGSIDDTRALAEGMREAEAVISALGTPGRTPTTVYSDGARALLDAMPDDGDCRILAISAAPAAPPNFQTVTERLLLNPLMSLFFGGAFADMRRMEQTFITSDAPWTVFRPTRLTNSPATGAYRTAVDAPLKRPKPLARADLAAALLAAITNDNYVRRSVAISG
ncbi:NAD(P)H-binding protein [Nocardia asteroides]|uniref:NAD(P)-dependent oxidoreductase n=1 Tax=Nocardia asteroides TaxID=1824 RepID=UPI00342328CD